MNTKTKLSPVAQTMDREERMTAVAILREARKLLTKVGWTKGVFRTHDDTGQLCGYCAVGAIIDARNLVAKRRKVPAVTSYKASSLLAEATGMHPITYNDLAKTTKRQVIAKFDKAIRAAGGTK